MEKNLKLSLAVFGIIFAAAIVYLASGLSWGSVASTSNTVLVQLTDPPVVPVGTQALVVYYSGVGLHKTGAGLSGHLNAQVSGKVNALNLTDVTQTIAEIKVGANDTFDSVRLNVSSAYIKINNVTYNVTIPNNKILASINGSIDKNVGAVLVDLRPVIVQVYTNNNQSIFLMAPSVKAVFVGKDQISPGTSKIGNITVITPKIKKRIASNATMTITGATATSIGNLTQLSITVKNTGNQSIVLKNLFMYGYMQVVPSYNYTLKQKYLPIQAPINATSASIANASNYYVGAAAVSAINSRLGQSVLKAQKINLSTNSGYNTNAAGGYGSAGIPPSAAISINEAQLFENNFHNSLNFIILPNKTMVLPYNLYNIKALYQNSNSGYTLDPGSSVTLAYNGVLGFNNYYVSEYPETGYGIATSVNGRQGGSIGSKVSVNTNIGNTVKNISVTNNNKASAAIQPYPTPVPPTTSRPIAPYISKGIILLIPNQSYDIAVHGTGTLDNWYVYAKGNVTDTGSTSYNPPSLVYLTTLYLTTRDVVGGGTNVTQLPGLIAYSNSTMYYTVYDNYNPYLLSIKNQSPYNKTVLSFQINTPGFALLNVSPPVPYSYGSGNGYLCAIPNAYNLKYPFPGGRCYNTYFTLAIKTPNTKYSGPLNITESYKIKPVNITANNTSSGSLSGIVSISPICPVERSDLKCSFNFSAHPEIMVTLNPISYQYAAKLQSYGKTYTIKIKPDGSFYLSPILSGAYILNLTGCTFLGCKYTLPTKIIISPNATTNVNITIDTGIR